MVWITQWLDYSSKYGLGYKISNGCVGVLFNDATKIVQSADRTRFEYMGKQQHHPRQQHQKDGSSSSAAAAAAPIVEVFRGRLDEVVPAGVPKDLRKKVALLRHFSDHFRKEQAREHQEMDTVGADCAGFVDDAPMIYVKKWITTRHAIVFRVSNHSIQVNFNDGAKLLLVSERKLVSFVDVRGQRSVYSLNQLPEDRSLLQRLKYAKGIIYQFVRRSACATVQS